MNALAETAPAASSGHTGAPTVTRASRTRRRSNTASVTNAAARNGSSLWMSSLHRRYCGDMASTA
ncbi:MAG: hypothetical protein MUE78_06765, partial [Ilumatobacteraceae bacterium]|nr:hypothetical protein [Ilumatobacteraceae bacterium]